MSEIEAAITAEVVRNALAVAVEEASVVVVRSSHSINIQEGADAAGALLDATGQLVAQSTATSVMHSASLRCGLQSLLSEIPEKGMVPGDIFACNDPYRGGIHANDIMLLRPIFAEGALRWFAGTLIHVADMGGSAVAGLGALATDTYAEGVLLPPVRLYRAGEANRGVLAIIERNSRAPKKVIGDVHALVAGVNVVARRMEELVARYGADELSRQIAFYVDYTTRRFAEEIKRIPAGTYRGRFTIDTDGVTPGRTFDVVVAVTVAEGRVTVDFTGTAAQSRGSINSSYSQTLSGVVYAIRCFTDPSIPMNEGLLPLHPHGAARGLAGEPHAAGGLRWAGGDGDGGPGGHRGCPGGRRAGSCRRSQLAHPRLLDDRLGCRRRALAHSRLRVRRDRRPPRIGWSRCHGRLLPRRSFGDPPDRASRAPAAVCGRALRPGSRLGRRRPVAGRAGPRDGPADDRPGPVDRAR